MLTIDKIRKVPRFTLSLTPSGRASFVYPTYAIYDKDYESLLPVFF